MALWDWGQSYSCTIFGDNATDTSYFLNVFLGRVLSFFSRNRSLNKVQTMDLLILEVNFSTCGRAVNSGVLEGNFIQNCFNPN